jgi:hypothetical protein
VKQGFVSRLKTFGSGVYADLRSKGAKVKSAQNSRGALTVGTVALLGAIAPIWGPLHDLLKNTPLLDQLVRSFTPLVLGSVCWRSARDKETLEQPASMIIGVSNGTADYYVFEERTRKAAWLAALVMFALTGVSLVPLWPTLGGAPYAGYVCNAQSREPVTSGTVELKDAIGRTLAAPLPLDGDGWFSLEALRPGLRPDALLLDSEDCRTKDLLRGTDVTSELDGCAGRESTNQHDRHGGPWPTWYVHCDAAATPR